MAVVSSHFDSKTMPVCVTSTEHPTVKTPALDKPRRRQKPATLAPGDRIGVWRVEGELGRGGMGTVYAVTHNGFGKRAALKLCHKNVLGPAFTIDTFLREARVVHLVNHPGVADVFATGTYDGRPYLAMERLHGKTLGDYLESRTVGRLEALDILFEICRVLAAAHDAGVVHRDLKLDNVLVLDGDGPVQIKVLDWGVARIVGEPDPMTGMIAGTLTYVAPEQIRADDLTPAGDIYSLGVLAYQLLCGEPPFVHQSDLELIRMHLHAPPPNPALTAAVPADFALVMQAMLSKDPEQRPSIDDIMCAIVAARRTLAPRKATLLSGVRAVPKAPPIDVLGRCAPVDLLGRLGALPRRFVGTIAAVAAASASLATLLGG